MKVPVTLPDLGEDTTTEVILSAWLVSRGQRIDEGEDLVELTTDKAAFTLPCPTAGVLIEILAPEGEVVTVGAVLGTLET